MTVSGEKHPVTTRAVIIAAGLGSRLVGDSGSKPLTLVSGVPMIERVIGQIVRTGINDVLVVTGYKADQLEAFLASLSARSTAHICTLRTEDWTKPNGHSVLTAARVIDEPYLLAMSDHLCDHRLISGLLEGGGSDAGLVLAVDYRLDNPTTDLEDATKVYCPDGPHISNIGKNIRDYNAIDTGFFLATPKLRTALEAVNEQNDSVSLSAAAQYLADCRQAQAYDIGAHWWIDVDNALMLQKAQALLQKECVSTG